MNDFQSYFVFAPIDYGIPCDDFSRVLLHFIDHFSQFFESEKNKNKRSRPSFDFWSMIKLILYGLYDDVSHISKITSYAEYNRIYQYV